MTDAAITANPPRKFKRGIVFIKKGLQAKFIVLVLVSVLLAVALIFGDIYYIFGRDIVGDLMDPGLHELFIQNNRILVLKLIVYLILIAVVTVFVSHKLAGPLYRFEKSTDEVKTGDLTFRVRLRKGDELMDLQDRFNAMLESLHGKVLSDRRKAEKLSQDIAAMAADAQLPSDVRARLEETRRELDLLTRAFKL